MFDGSTGDPTVIAFDPGATTGWALASVHPDALVEPDVLVLDNILHFAWGQFTGTEYRVVRAMVDLYDEWPGAGVVIEDFVLRKFDRSRELLAPVRVTAAFRYHSLEREAVCEIQPGSLAFSTITDERLARFGYAERLRGTPHAKDATKHLFTFLKRLKSQPKLLARVFPKVGDGSA